MKIYKENEIEKLANILKNDGVICVPTDTVYGVCARINSKKAYDNLVKIKNRPSDKSFPVMCLDESQIEEIAILDSNARKLIKAFMPGPISLILKKKPDAFSYINNAGTRLSDELAVRIAPLKILEELLKETKSPIFLTSANKSGEKVCDTVDEILKTFPNIDGILEGIVNFKEPSTIVDCTSSIVKIQRDGPITREMIMKVLGD